jgi:hypothetical protein
VLGIGGRLWFICAVVVDGPYADEVVCAAGVDEPGGGLRKSKHEQKTKETDAPSGEKARQVRPSGWAGLETTLMRNAKEIGARDVARV